MEASYSQQAEIYEADLIKVVRAGRKRLYPKGLVIQSTESIPNFTFVDSGYVKRYLITTEGNQSIQGIYGPGDVFPLTMVLKLLFNQVLRELPETYYYETMTPVKAHTITSDELLEAVKSDPLLYRPLLFLAGERLHSNIQPMENRSLSSTSSRLAHQLVYYAKRFGIIEPSGVKIGLKLTHQDLANVLNFSRENVSRAMVKLRQKGLIVDNDGIFIPDLRALEKVAFS